MTCSTPDCKNEPTHKNKIAGAITCTECMESSIDARFYDVADFEAIGQVGDEDDTGTDVKAQLIKDEIEIGESFELKKPDGTSERIDPENIESAVGDLLHTNNTTALTILEASLAEDLIKIKTDAATLPELAKTDTEYKDVYEFSTRLKRFSVAVRKKEKLLQDDLKSDFKESKTAIASKFEKLQKDLKSDFSKSKAAIGTQLETIMNTITPLIKTTLESRDFMECHGKAIKENIAMDLAVQQKKERIRIKAEKAKIKTDKKIDQDKKAEDIKAAQEKLDRERYEFECDKTRLTYIEAWEDIKNIIDEKEKQDSEIPEMEINLKTIDKNKADDQEAIKIGEEYFAGDRKGVSQEELDEILDEQPEPDTETVEIGGKVIEVSKSDSVEDVRKKYDEAPIHKTTVTEFGPGPNGSCISNEVEITSDVKTSTELNNPRVAVIGNPNNSEAIISKLKSESPGIVIASEQETAEINLALEKCDESAQQIDPVYEPDKFIVINRKFLKILSADQMDQLQYLFSMLHTDNKYYVCNQDEPYADQVIEIILEGEKAKGDNSPV